MARPSAGRVVDRSNPRRGRVLVVPRLRHVGGDAERALRVRPVSLAVLFAAAVGRRRTTRGSGQAGLVPAGAVLSGAADPAVPRSLPFHLLLLPRRLLQGVLAGPGLVRRRRAARHELLGRALVPARAAERAPLLRLRGGRLHRHPVVRRLAGAVVDECGDRADGVRHRRRHARDARQRAAHRQLHLRLPLAAAPVRRPQATNSRRRRSARPATGARAR